MNQQKVHRLWREEGRWVPQRRRKRAGTTTAPISAAVKAVSIVDEHTRETLGGLVQHNTTTESLTRELDRTTAIRGTRPIVLPSDNGPEFACQAMSDWPGQPSRL